MSKLSVSCNFFLSAHSTGEQRKARRKLAVVAAPLMVDDSGRGSVCVCVCSTRASDWSVLLSRYAHARGAAMELQQSSAGCCVCVCAERRRRLLLALASLSLFTINYRVQESTYGELEP